MREENLVEDGLEDLGLTELLLLSLLDFSAEDPTGLEILPEALKVLHHEKHVASQPTTKYEDAGHADETDLRLLELLRFGVRASEG